MDIRFVSSLTPEDEAHLAAVIGDAAARLLDRLSLVYTLRIRTTDGQLFHHQSDESQPIAPDLGLRSES